jgi:hypothetical protein
MNERIQKLEKEAWEFVDKTWDWSNPDNPSQATLFKTKFAEMIVKECADVAKQFYKNNKEYDASLAIEQHFGVKE